MNTHEIGKANEVDLPKADYLVHVRGNPAQEALLINKMQNEGKTQKQIGEALDLSQPQISKRLTLLSLDPRLFAKIEKGELRPSAGYLLAKLPAGIQKAYAISKDKTTIKALEKERRDLTVSKELETLFLAPSPFAAAKAKKTHKCPKCGAEVPCD